MLTMFVAGGYPMWIVTVLGVACLVTAARFAMRGEPRHLAAEQKDALLALSRQVMAHLEERRTSAALRGAMQALTRSEAMFRDAYENAPIGIAFVSPEGELLRVNQSLCDMLGYVPDELTRTDAASTTRAAAPPGSFHVPSARLPRSTALSTTMTPPAATARAVVSGRLT